MRKKVPCVTLIFRKLQQSSLDVFRSSVHVYLFWTWGPGGTLPSALCIPGRQWSFLPKRICTVPETRVETWHRPPLMAPWWWLSSHNGKRMTVKEENCIQYSSRLTEDTQEKKKKLMNGGSTITEKSIFWDSQRHQHCPSAYVWVRSRRLRLVPCGRCPQRASSGQKGQ